MTTENNETPETNPTNEAKSAANGGWGKWVAVGAVAAMLVGGAGIASAISDEGGRYMQRFGFDQSERMGGGFTRVHMGMGGHGIGRALDAIDATDEQADQIYDIMDTARDSVRPLMREFRDTRDDLTEILSADTIDRQALETLRAERVAAIDTASKTMTEALLNAADVLTPEQRAELVKLFEEHGRRGMRGRW
ncbi:MAG: Spy/CpxP family protein refolding chaperone [Rhizobiaceae bacterium]|nr:Spy/CpxP family protein refolding chaperone [Rhizobiaceae bacterium]